MKKVCLITGGATGIGAACALAFAQAGWDLMVGFLPESSQEQSAEGVAKECRTYGAMVRLVALDVADDRQCRAAVSLTDSIFGRLEALVNCAGTTRFIPHAQLDALSSQEFHRTYDVNVVGTFQMIRACAQMLGKGGNGAVVNISSIGGLHGLGSSIAYAASKGALNTLTLAMARTLAPNIRVNAVAPGYVDGGLPSRVLPQEDLDRLVRTQVASTLLQRVAQPREIADFCLFLCEKAIGVTGEIVSVDNGFHLKLGA